MLQRLTAIVPHDRAQGILTIPILLALTFYQAGLSEEQLVGRVTLVQVAHAFLLGPVLMRDSQGHN